MDASGSSPFTTESEANEQKPSPVFETNVTSKQLPDSVTSSFGADRPITAKSDSTISSKVDTTDSVFLKSVPMENEQSDPPSDTQGIKEITRNVEAVPEDTFMPGTARKIHIVTITSPEGENAKVETTPLGSGTVARIDFPRDNIDSAPTEPSGGKGAME